MVQLSKTSASLHMCTSHHVGTHKQSWHDQFHKSDTIDICSGLKPSIQQFLNLQQHNLCINLYRSSFASGEKMSGLVHQPQKEYCAVYRYNFVWSFLAFFHFKHTNNIVLIILFSHNVTVVPLMLSSYDVLASVVLLSVKLSKNTVA